MESQPHLNQQAQKPYQKLHKKILPIVLVSSLLFITTTALIIYFVKPEKNTPPNNQQQDEITFIEIGKEYDSASHPVDIGGKLAYVAKNKDAHFVVYDGSKIEHEYDSIHDIANIGGKLAFSASKNGKSFVVYDGDEIIKDHFAIFSLKNIGGKLVFKALRTKQDRDLGNYYIYSGGLELGEKYDFINGDPVQINGRVAFLARQETKNVLVIDDEPATKEYANVDYLTAVGTTYAFMARDFPQKKAEFTGSTSEFARQLQGKDIIVYDGKELGQEYDSASLPFELNGKLLYLAKKDGKTILVYNGRQIAKEYDNVASITNVNGKLAFIGQQGNDIFIDFDGKKIEGALGPSERIQYLQSVGGKLVYVLKKDDGFHVVYDGKNVGVYDYIPPQNGWREFITEINSKLVLVAKNDEKWNIIYGEKVVAQYDGVDYLTTVNGKLVFSATRGIGPAEEKFIVIQK